MHRGLLIALMIVFAAGMMTSCSTSGKKDELQFSEVELTSDPTSPIANAEAKLTVTINNDAFAQSEAEVQLQVNAKGALPKLIDAVREGDQYVATYAFPIAEKYVITVHLSYEEDHYAFAKELVVK